MSATTVFLPSARGLQWIVFLRLRRFVAWAAFLFAAFDTLLIIAASRAGATTQAVRQARGVVRMEYDPQQSFLLVGIGILMCMVLWHDDEPRRRAYFWTLPVNRFWHAAMKCAAGWIIVTGLAVGFVLNMMVMGSLLAALQHYPVVPHASLQAWHYLVPLVAGTVAYLFTTSIMLASDRPVAWLIGIPLTYLASRWTTQNFGYPRLYSMLESLWSGSHGMCALITGGLTQIGNYPATAPFSAWAGSVVVWSALALLAVAGAAQWRQRLT